jgi:phosphoserine phosphatase
VQMANNEELFIFDLDYTLAKGNISYEFGQHLFKRKYFSLPICVCLIVSYLLHKIGLLSVKNVNKFCFFLIFRGHLKNKIEEEADLFFADNIDRLFRPEMLEILKNAHSRKSKTWILSSSPEFLVRPIARILSCTNYYATRYLEDKDARFVCVSSVFDGKKKSEVLKNFIKDNPSVTWNVTVYTDSYLDYQLLECANVPIAVCPDRKLKQIAGEKGWTILEFPNNPKKGNCP